MAGNVSPSNSTATTPSKILDLGGVSLQAGTTSSGLTSKDTDELQNPTASLKRSPLRVLYSNELVTIEVGAARVPFVVHKGLICSKSNFFNAAFNGFFREATTQSVYLREDSPEDFDIIHKWLYTVLGDKFDLAEVCDSALVHMSDLTAERQKISTGTVMSIYERTGPNSQLRRFLVAVLMQNFQHNIDEVTIHNPHALTGCPEILVDLLASVKQQTQSPYEAKPIELCAYHRHVPNRRCRYAGITQSFTAVELYANVVKETQNT
ncbi:MAG: hypothetical protein Q9213_002303 [Squamulea squamosa]